ncbi:hypothetical protein IQ06DRAFT_138240 [Phaeosphaeriaceae sp. SRC1lsM3a]|nr:hypothetical protein IQ06DRAFT_138240 [Stagonospora sp. SRC1lsM3a]
MLFLPRETGPLAKQQRLDPPPLYSSYLSTFIQHNTTTSHITDLSRLTMASLLTLPNELQDIVIEHLTTPDLINVALTCKHFHTLALHKAYKNLTLNWINAPENVKRNPRLDHLHQTFDSRPDLEEQVNRLTLATSGCISFDDEGQYVVAIPSYGQRTDFSFDMHRLLCRCTLESLDIAVELFLRPDPLLGQSWITHAFERALQCHEPPAWMRALKCVRTTCEFTKFDWEPNKSTPRIQSLMFFLLPNIETLDLAYFDPSIALNEDGDEIDDEEIIRTFWTFDRLPLASPMHLHTLRIGFSSTRALFLELVLKHLPSLRVFDIELFQHEANFPFDLDRLKMGLDYVKKTLTHLRLRYDVIDDGSMEDTRDFTFIVSGSIGSMREFAALSHLEISLQVLFGYEDSHEYIFYPLSAVLPPELEVLLIPDDLYMFLDFWQSFEDAHAMAFFTQYLEEGEWKAATPKLKSFTYDLRQGGKDYTIRYWSMKEKRDALRSMIKAQGLEGTLLWD